MCENIWERINNHKNPKDQAELKGYKAMVGAPVIGSETSPYPDSEGASTTDEKCCSTAPK